MNWFNNLFSGATDAETVPWDAKALVIDVRSPGEFASGHVEGAFNVPLDVFAQVHARIAPDKSRQIILYCQSGARSGQALQFLQQHHYENVVNGVSVSVVAAKTQRPIVR